MHRFHINCHCGKCIQWEDDEFDKVSERILNLTDEQIIRLHKKIGLLYDEAFMKESLEEMREDVSSIAMDRLTSEAESKADLLKWIEYFEKEN